jgi:predicted nucleotidyltransferase
LALVRLRDRDAIITKEGLIFRVFGYNHPQNAFVSDAEYASAEIFKSNDPRAPRNGGNQIFYKFYNDEGWKLIFSQFPQYTVFHEMLGQRVVGVHHNDVAEVRKPKERLRVLVEANPKDELHDAMQRVLKIALQGSGLSTENFGVFGSMLHGFHHPKFSDIDLIVYGKEKIAAVQETLEALYANGLSGFRNEFETIAAMKGKQWRFKNYSIKEFVWHQQRKQIYGLFDDGRSGRTIKAEFEPVKEWSEITSEYDSNAKILHKGWAKLNARVTDDADAPFIPSVYGIEPLEVSSGAREALEAVRIISYLEEFRLQARKDEKVVVEGNLEEVVSPTGRFHQVTLTYCPRYYEQVLKVAALNP